MALFPELEKPCGQVWGPRRWSHGCEDCAGLLSRHVKAREDPRWEVGCRSGQAEELQVDGPGAHTGPGGDECGRDQGRPGAAPGRPVPATGHGHTGYQSSLFF